MKTQIDRDALKELCEKVDLLEYASQLFNFKKHGPDEYFTHCPLHIDNTPSLSITKSKNLWYCHSCKKGGNIIQFMMVFEKLSFQDAIHRLLELTNSNLNSLRICEAMAFFQEIRDSTIKTRLQANTKDRVYLQKSYYETNFLDEIPNEWIDEGISIQELKKYEIRIDPFSNRIVYPVYDHDFKLIGVKGRTRFQNYKELHLAKYMNYYPIGDLDYFNGMKQAVDSVNTSHEIILVEGMKSIMKLDGWGYHNCVSTETSTINDFQVRLMLQMRVKNVIVAFDKDVLFKKLVDQTVKLRKFTNVFVVYDRKNLLSDKMSPCDKGLEVWRKLYSERIRL